MFVSVGCLKKEEGKLTVRSQDGFHAVRGIKVSRVTAIDGAELWVDFGILHAWCNRIVCYLSY
jgi:hypothetical protein